MASPARGRPQRTLTDIVVALASSSDPGEALARAAETMAAAAAAVRLEIWSYGGGGGPVVCEAVCRRDDEAAGTPPDSAGADAHRQTHPRTPRHTVRAGTVADLAARPDLRAVLGGEATYEARWVEDLDDTTRALLDAHGASRTVAIPLRLGEQTVGAVALTEAGPTASLTAGDRKRLALLGRALAGAVRSAGQTRAGETAARQAESLRAASRAVADLVESDQAVDALTHQIAALVGGPDADVRVYLRTDAGAYAPFPPRESDETNGAGVERPNDLERRALEERRTIAVGVAGAVRLATPLMLRGAPLGFLALIASRHQPLTASEIEGVETLAQQISLTLDIARLRRAVQRLTTSDTLTGLMNREFLYERLTAEIVRARRYQQPLSFALVDLDDFRAFNRRWGNREGNRLLRAVANLVKLSIRDRIDVACRYGGEEFALVLPNTPPTASGAGVVAERVRSSVETTQFRDENDDLLGRVTVSIGVSGFPLHAEDAEDLVSTAFEALRAAKAAGKNRVGLFSLRR